MGLPIHSDTFALLRASPISIPTNQQDVCHHANYLRISVTDKDCVGTFDVGGCLVDLRKLMDGEKVNVV